MEKKHIEIVIPCFNEEACIPLVYQAVHKIGQSIDHYKISLLYVDDGSRDTTLVRIKEVSQYADPDEVHYISFARNFGKEAAIYAGLSNSRADYIALMDADLQHPVECIPEIIKNLEEGAQVINMVRTKNESAGWFKNLASTAFYKLINMLSDVKFESNASDFFAVSGRVAQVLKKDYREKIRFLRGYVQSVGFKKIVIEYEAHPRVAGESKYSIRKLFQFSVNTIVCFSNLPLKLGVFAGLFAGVLGVLVLVYTLFTRNGAPSGYATIVILNCFMFAILFLLVGIIGEYIAILFAELKDRPIYIVEETQNL